LYFLGKGLCQLLESAHQNGWNPLALSAKGRLGYGTLAPGQD
jgi:hypothetical protein